ncbi:MAG: hypothetical protein JWM16_3974 [Verrucomicrobiales bacterium]|nr:hypothetical protein [Verrucomicrobiales bacterium]
MKLHLALALSLVLTVLFGSRGHAAQAPQPASALAKPSVSGAGGSYSPQFSADGRFLIFTSHAPNLTTNENDQGFLNIYSREMSSGQITLISVRGTGDRPGNNSSSSPSVSSNGQFIAFESDATDLVPGDTNGFKDIFLRDTASGATTLVSVNASGVGGGNGVSSNPSISPDGRFILFESSAENLVPDDTNRIADLFLRDRLAGTTTLISVGAQGPPGSPFGSFTRSGSASMSADGTRVVFVSTATNLVLGVGSSLGEVYVRDLTTGRTSWASSNSVAIASGPWRSFNPVISPDGHFIVFKTLISQQPVNVYLTLQDLQTGKLTLVDHQADTLAWPGISGDGSKIASESNPQSIAIWNTADVTNSPVLIPITNAGFGPVLSPDGRRMAILSAASSGVTNTLFGTVQLFVIDLPSGEIRLASVNLSRTASADLSGTHPSMDPTGNLLAFEIPDGKLVIGDNNQSSDIFVYDWSSDSVSLVSTALAIRPNKTLAGFSLSGQTAVSANGRYVAFATSDTNLYVTTNFLNIAVWDTWLNTNILYFTLTNKAIPTGGGQPGTNAIETASLAVGPVLSLDGTVLAHIASATYPSYNGGAADIRVLNLLTGTSSLLGHSSAGPFPTGRSGAVSMDAAHHLIAYQSTTQDIPTGVPDNNFNAADIFIYDTILRSNRLVTVNGAGTSTANGSSANPLISSDGRWVLFQSIASDLISGISNYPPASPQEFVRDLVTSNTFLLSANSNGLPLSGIVTSHVFSLNSHLAAFGGRFDFGDGREPIFTIAVADLYSKTNRFICNDCQNPSLDASGRWIAYEKRPSASSAGDVVVQDLQSGQESLVSAAYTGGAGGNAISLTPLISSDGRYVVFVSKASNLVSNDNNGTFDVFVRDRILNKITLLSLSRDGTQSANGSSARPALSADGRTVIFQSVATDLAEGDFNGKRDVFVARLGSGDSDADGMDDDWELAYFGTLSRDGQGDFDDDSVTDLEEFRAGTDPTNHGSVLRVISLTKLGSGEVSLIWNSVPGKNYHLQFRDTLDPAPWQTMPGNITALGSTTTAQDTGPVLNRFYRVVTAE